MKKLCIKSLVCGVMASCAALLSSCNNAGNSIEKPLEVQNHILAHHGLQLNSTLIKSDIRVDFKDIVYGNDMYMIVGSHGSIYTSPDATRWTEQYGVTKLNLNAVAFNETYKKFYAVGDEGKLFSSADGVSWIEYKTLNININLRSISVLSDGNVAIGGNHGSIFELVFRGADGEKNTVSVTEMQSTSGKEDSNVTSLAISPEYMVAGSDLGSLASKIFEDFRGGDWSYVGSNNNTGVTDVFYATKISKFISLSKNGYINTADAQVYHSQWSAVSYTDYPSKESYELGITTNSIVVDHNSPYTFIVGGDKNNKDEANNDTYIRYAKDMAQWNAAKTLYPKTGSLNKVRCFSGKPENMCIAVGDKKAIVIIRIKDDEVKPEPIDINDPEIKSYKPDVDKNAGAKDVNLTPLMELTFNKPVNHVSSNVFLYKEQISDVDEVKLFDFVASQNDDEYTFKPIHKLDPYTHYWLLVESGVQDNYGKNIVSKVFDFTTGNKSYPEVKSVIPANNEISVDTLTNIKVTFSEPVKNVDTKNVTLHLGSKNGALVGISTPEDVGNAQYVFAPVSKLKPLTPYCVVFSPGITDFAGTSIREYTSCFTTGEVVTGLSVDLIKPNKNAEDVSLLPQLEFVFSSSVIGVNKSSVTLHEGSKSGATVKLGDITNNGGNVYKTYTESLLKMNTNYYLVFDSTIKDAANPDSVLPETVFTFKTKPDSVVAITTSDACIYAYKRSGALTCVAKLISNQMNKVIYSSSRSRYIAVGKMSKSAAPTNAFFSNNGINWTAISIGKIALLNSVAFLNEVEPYVVAVGTNGAIAVSSDLGATWVDKSGSVGTKNIKNIYSDGVNFYISADGGDWYYSRDKGNSWEKLSDSVLPKNNVQNILAGHDNYRIVGGYNGQIYSSSDEMASWIEQKSVQYKAPGASANSTFNDYLYFEQLSLNMLFGNNGTLFISVGDNSSKDNWNRVTSIVSDDNINTVNFVGASVNNYGEVYMASTNEDDEGAIYMSNDGVHWIKIKHVFDEALYSIVAID